MFDGNVNKCRATSYLNSSKSIANFQGVKAAVASLIL